MKEAPIESTGTTVVVERYRAPLRAAYGKIRASDDREITDQECLKM